MRAVCISMPMTTMAWSTFNEAVAAAAASLGYRNSAETTGPGGGSNETGAVEQLSVIGEVCVATFSRDVHGKTSLYISGNSDNELTLRALGEELSRAVVQQYIYRTLLADIRARGLDIVGEEQKADHSIQLKIRHWDN